MFGNRARAFRDDRNDYSRSGRGGKAGYHVRDRRAGASPSSERGSQSRGTVRPIGCITTGYIPRMTGRTTNMPNLSPSLRGCFADPVELALEEHAKRLPRVIADPGAFRTEHKYNHDPAAWPRQLAVTTVCHGGRLRTFVHRPEEDVTIFGAL